MEKVPNLQYLIGDGEWVGNGHIENSEYRSYDYRQRSQCGEDGDIASEMHLPQISHTTSGTGQSDVGELHSERPAIGPH
jgi:hypothetical protein